MKRLISILAMLCVVGCSDQMDSWTLTYENGLTFSGPGKLEKPVPFFRMEGGTLMPSPLDRSAQDSLRFLIGENEINLLEVDPEQLEQLGFKKTASVNGWDYWIGIYRNGTLKIALDGDGVLSLFRYSSGDKSSDPEFIDSLLMIRFADKPPIQLPMTEDEIREYFGTEYDKNGSIGWDL